MACSRRENIPPQLPMLLHKEGKANLRDIRIDSYLPDTRAELWKCPDHDQGGADLSAALLSEIRRFPEHRTESGHHAPPAEVSQTLGEMVTRITIDDDLVRLPHREEERDSLLNGGYFSDTEKNHLERRIKETIPSFEYEEQLSEQIREEFSTEGAGTGPPLQPSRDPAFRRLVLKSYAETCAVCGARLVTSGGVSVIDAAHILPFSRFRNDDVRNGLALCKIHHWLFDKGLISVDERYTLTRRTSKERPSL